MYIYVHISYLAARTLTPFRWSFLDLIAFLYFTYRASHSLRCTQSATQKCNNAIILLKYVKFLLKYVKF